MWGSSLAVLPLRYSFESGSVFDSCVSLLRRCPLKSPPLPPSSSPSLRTKLLCPAQASINVPSTLKCSPDNQSLFSAVSSTSLKKATTASCSIRRWRFLLNTVGTHTASSIARPRNQRNNMLYWVCSMSWRSEHALNRICSSIARSSSSGAMLGRPPLMSASYIGENNPSILASTSLTITRMRRSGGSAGTKSSSRLLVNKPSVNVSGTRIRGFRESAKTTPQAHLRGGLRGRNFRSLPVRENLSAHWPHDDGSEVQHGCRRAPLSSARSFRLNSRLGRARHPYVALSQCEFCLLLLRIWAGNHTQAGELGYYLRVGQGRGDLLVPQHHDRLGCTGRGGQSHPDHQVETGIAGLRHRRYLR